MKPSLIQLIDGMIMWSVGLWDAKPKVTINYNERIFLSISEIYTCYFDVALFG